MYKGAISLFSLLVLIRPVSGQDSTRLSFSVYGEVYYSYDFSRPPTHTRPPFVYSHNRIGEVNLNLGLFRASFSSERARANLGLMAGTYSNANLAAEPGVLKNLYEANAGVRISKHRQLWVDAGVLPSHIGWESAVGKDNWTLTRSMAADNSPYYEAGIRLSYQSTNQKWYAALLLLNGWQRIERAAGNHTPALGTQVTFKPTDKVLMNFSTFVGSDQPDSTRKMRYFHNLFSTIHLSDKIGVTLGLDIGLEQKQKGSTSMSVWYTPVLTLRHRISETKFIALRGEYYHDQFGVIIRGVNGEPFITWSCSANFDWALTQNLLWRAEAKWMQSKHPVFLLDNGTYGKSNLTATTTFCFYF